MASAPIQEGLHSTRQLLDELDALMDQMLALPVDQPDEAESKSSPSPAPMVSATLTMLASASEDISSASTESRPVAPFWTHEKYEEKRATASDWTTEPIAVPVLKDVAAPPKTELTRLPDPVPSASWTPVQIANQFLVWVNQGYDHGVGWLGTPGQFLQSRSGRAVLGCLGLGLLAAALVWLGRDLLGWNW